MGRDRDLAGAEASWAALAREVERVQPALGALAQETPARGITVPPP
jgi:hypothetical protein